MEYSFLHNRLLKYLFNNIKFPKASTDIISINIDNSNCSILFDYVEDTINDDGKSLLINLREQKKGIIDAFTQCYDLKYNNYKIHNQIILKTVFVF